MNNDAFDSLQYAMKTLQETANTASLSFEEAVDAMCSLARMGRRIVEREQYKIPNDEYEPVLASLKLEETRQEVKNPYLEDFEIPHYNFEDIDIKDLIDF